MMNSFDHMVMSLQQASLEIAKHSTSTFTLNVEVNPKKIKITKDEYEKFYKEFLFEKLKGTKLAHAFIEKFKEFSEDILFKISMSDEETTEYIRKFYLK